MTTEYMNDIEKTIQKAALDGVLTKGAVEQFHELIHERDALLKTTDSQGLALEDEAKKNVKLNQRNEVLENECQTWAGKEQDLLDREAKCTELEIRKECALLRVEDHKEMFKTVFRNSVLRKEVMSRNDSHTEATGACHNSYETKETLHEEET